MLRSLHSFKFFIKERWFLCVLLLSLWENVEFFAIFYILYKKTQHSFRSFWFHKNNIKEWCILKVVLFAIYIYISIYIYIYLYISISIYISIYIYKYIFKKKIKGWACMLFKRMQRSAFFCVLLHKNVAFFAKERCVLCVLLCS